MSKKLIALLFVVALGVLALGAGEVDTRRTNSAGHVRVCVDGIAYLVFQAGVTVQYQSDGRIAGCSAPIPRR